MEIKQVESSELPQDVQVSRGNKLANFNVQELQRDDNGSTVTYYKYNQIELPENTTDEDVQVALIVVAKAEAQTYLNSTDWYYARLAETGQAVPEDVVTKRIEARELL
jgi:hypothetical protein